MPLKPNFGWTLTAILLVALGVRLVAGVWWQQRLPEGKRFAFGDSVSYWELAGTIARGHPYEYGPGKWKIFRTPGYPAVLAPLFLIREEPPVLWARAVSALLSTAAVGVVGILAWMLFDQRTAVIASLISAFYPEAIALGTFVLSEAPFTPLMMLTLLFWTLAWRTSATNVLIGWSITAGVSAGLATLMRPSWLLFVPFACFAGLAQSVAQRNATAGVPYSAWRRHASIGGIMFAGLCLTMTPWWIRNYDVSRRFVPTSLQVGASLYDGLSPTATGASDMEFVGSFVAEQKAADAQPGADTSGLFEDRLDTRLRQASLTWAKENPSQVLRLVGIKLFRMWSPIPNATEFGSPWLRLILALTYTPVIGLALVGVWRLVRRDWPYLLCVLPAIYFTSLHVIFVSSIRYRQPVMLPLIVLAAAALTTLMKERAVDS